MGKSEVGGKIVNFCNCESAYNSIFNKQSSIHIIEKLLLLVEYTQKCMQHEKKDLSLLWSVDGLIKLDDCVEMSISIIVTWIGISF